MDNFDNIDYNLLTMMIMISSGHELLGERLMPFWTLAFPLAQMSFWTLAAPLALVSLLLISLLLLKPMSWLHTTVLHVLHVLYDVLLQLVSNTITIQASM